MNDKLAKSNAKFGSALSAEAKKLHREMRQNRLVSRVRYIYDAIETAEGIINKNQQGIEFFKRQLKAIEAGEIAFGPGDEIIFNDQELQRERAFS